MTTSQILDACVLINLLASDEFEAILHAGRRRSFICTAVESESIYLRTDDASTPVERIDLRPLIDSKVLTICAVTDEEVESYVDYASVLSDGEAMSLAIALSREYVLVTDDRKARRLFVEASGDSNRLASTSDLLQNWANENIPAFRLKQVLSRVERRARYQPSPTDAHYDWWIDASR